MRAQVRRYRVPRARESPRLRVSGVSGSLVTVSRPLPRSIKQAAPRQLSLHLEPSLHHYFPSDANYARR